MANSDILLSLIRLSLGASADEMDLSVLSESDWKENIDLSFEQGVAAIAVDGLQLSLELRAESLETKPNITVMKRLPKEDYDMLARSCDVGLIFLDYRFTIPNYPSRLLSCLTQHKPIIACTDPNCDTGTIAEANGYGFWCPSNSVEAFTKAVDKMLASDTARWAKTATASS